MSTLKAFSENERADNAYQARQNFLREQRSIQRELQNQHAARAAAVREKEVERHAKESALAELERQKALLQDRTPREDS